MKTCEKTDSLEGFMRRQERLIKQNEFYKRLIIIPVIMIVVSISVLAYNFTAGRQQSTDKQQKYDTVMVKTRKPFDENSTEKINLNSATAEMLDNLPEIGPKKADAIIKMRDRMGGFRSVEDILNVDGIGETILAEIRHMVCVETD